jgi:hypothetical protein
LKEETNMNQQDINDLLKELQISTNFKRLNAKSCLSDIMIYFTEYNDQQIMQRRVQLFVDFMNDNYILKHQKLQQFKNNIDSLKSQNYEFQNYLNTFFNNNHVYLIYDKVCDTILDFYRVIVKHS